MIYAGPGDKQLRRKNDAGFSYTLQNAPFEVSTVVRRNTGVNEYMALGADLDSGGSLGFMFGMSSGDFYVRGASAGTAVRVADNITDSVGLELRLAVDPQANSGKGIGSLSFRVAGTTGAYTEVAGLQSVDLQLDRMAESYRDPSTWNFLYVRAGSGGGLDDLTIRQTVPEPSSSAILGLGCGMLIFSRRRTR